jgi:hypothetical protein
MAIDERRGLRAGGPDEVGELSPERLIAFDRQWSPLDRRARTLPGHEPPALDFLCGVVDGNVRVRLEEPDLPDPLAADAACRDVRNSS